MSQAPHFSAAGLELTSLSGSGLGDYSCYECEKLEIQIEIPSDEAIGNYRAFSYDSLESLHKLAELQDESCRIMVTEATFLKLSLFNLARLSKTTCAWYTSTNLKAFIFDVRDKNFSVLVHMLNSVDIEFKPIDSSKRSYAPSILAFDLFFSDFSETESESEFEPEALPIDPQSTLKLYFKSGSRKINLSNFVPVTPVKSLIHMLKSFGKEEREKMLERKAEEINDVSTELLGDALIEIFSGESELREILDHMGKKIPSRHKTKAFMFLVTMFNASERSFSDFDLKSPADEPYQRYLFHLSKYKSENLAAAEEYLNHGTVTLPQSVSWFPRAIKMLKTNTDHFAKTVKDFKDLVKTTGYREITQEDYETLLKEVSLKDRKDVKEPDLFKLSDLLYGDDPLTNDN